MTKFEDVAGMTTEEYFNNNQFSIDAFNKKYTAYEGETPVKAIKRVCDYIASVEKDPKYWSERWFDEIFDQWWFPAGSIMQGSISGKRISLANCTTISLGNIDNKNEWDSLEGIIRDAAYTVAKTAAYRQGLGIDFSRLRPRNAEVLNSCNKSTGSVHWMQFIDTIGYFVGQKGRIPAFLFSISCKHPDLLEFIECKKDRQKVQNANISVQVTEDFYEAVENDKEWEMKFVVPAQKIGDKIYINSMSAVEPFAKDENDRFYYLATKNRKEEIIVRKESARKILELIAKGMLYYAEPGIQNIDIARRWSNSDYVYDEQNQYDTRVSSTNACCVTGDTEILTKDGYFPIESLVDEDVEVWNGKEWTKVKPFNSGKNRLVFKVTLSDGRSLVCTDNHKWIVSLSYWGDEKRVKTSDLKIGDKLVKYDLPIIFGKNILEHPYTQGFVSGDGMDDYQLLWLYEPKFMCQHRLTGVKKISNDFNTYTNVRRRSVSLNFLPLPKTFVPFGYDKKSMLDWFAGLLDSDGCELKEGGIQIVSIDRKFLSDLQKFLTLLGCNSKVVDMGKSGYRDMPDGQGGIGKYFCQQSWRICVGARAIQSLIDLGLKCERHTFKKNPDRDASRFAVVKSIEDFGFADTYCFTDEKQHTGLFNGIMTGQSEQFLSANSLCFLSSINVGRFPANDYDKELEKIGYSINRFLDDVNECEIKYKTYPTENQKIAIEQLRRTGAGLTNIAGWLMKRNLPYGTEEANAVFAKFNERYNYYLYKSSINLGKEKGSFKAFDRKKLEQSPFIQHMMDLGLEFEALRNITCSSIAPVGTLSLMFREMVVSYGVEPPFALYFWKRTRISGEYKYYFCVPGAVRQIFAAKGYEIPMKSDTIEDTWDGASGKIIAAFIDKNKSLIGIDFRSASEVTASDKVNLMSMLMKDVDSSISVTYQLSETATWQDVYEFILNAHSKGLKSIAAFPDKKMYGIVSYIPFKKLALNLTESGTKIHAQNFSAEELKVVEAAGFIQADRIVKNIAPKRPRALPADVHHAVYCGGEYYIVVGILNGDPYEVFVGHNKTGEGRVIPLTVRDGVVKKNARGSYVLEVGQNVYSISILEDGALDAITRLISASLRHGADINFIVHQLEKTQGDMKSFAKVLGRTLKKYIKDGSPVTGATCLVCGSGELKREDGCITCIACGSTRCN